MDGKATRRGFKNWNRKDSLSGRAKTKKLRERGERRRQRRRGKTVLKLGRIGHTLATDGARKGGGLLENVKLPERNGDREKRRWIERGGASLWAWVRKNTQRTKDHKKSETSGFQKFSEGLRREKRFLWPRQDASRRQRVEIGDRQAHVMEGEDAQEVSRGLGSF